MDKKFIQSAIDDILSLRQAQAGAPLPQTGKVVQIPLSPGANDPLFKGNLDNHKLATIGMISNAMIGPAGGDPVAQISDRVSQVILDSLKSAGYQENINYSEDQTNEFAQAVATGLEKFLSGYGTILQDLAV